MVEGGVAHAGAVARLPAMSAWRSARSRSDATLSSSAVEVEKISIASASNRDQSRVQRPARSPRRAVAPVTRDAALVGTRTILAPSAT